MGERLMLVTIIIPAYNVELWIEQCIKSILDQSYKKLEIIIIDDGSTDTTKAIIQRFADSDSRIHAVGQQNQGLSAVRNRGISISQGEILLFVDSDDWIHKDTVADAVKLFEKNKIDVVIYQCAKYYNSSHLWGGGTDEYYWCSFSKSNSITYKMQDLPQTLVLYPLAQLKVISKAFIISNGLFFIEGLKYEDNPFHVAVFRSNPSISLLKNKYYAWRQGLPGQITAKPHASDCLKVIDEMLREAETLNFEAHQYLIIAITRLVSSVAKNILDNEDRKCFLNKCVSKLRNAIDDEALDEATHSKLIEGTIHPGDYILVKGLLFSSNSFSAALGSGLSRYWGGLITIFLATRTGNILESIKLIFTLSLNYKLIFNHSKGRGESNVKGLG